MKNRSVCCSTKVPCNNESLSSKADFEARGFQENILFWMFSGEYSIEAMYEREGEMLAWNNFYSNSNLHKKNKKEIK